MDVILHLDVVLILVSKTSRVFIIYQFVILIKFSLIFLHLGNINPIDRLGIPPTNMNDGMFM